ncbi:MAG: U32 family peptidase C-terminal domain-containing protein [Bdellovibrionales bacterium]|nr:U32 family peptidase C-terminal domain-containing protein [Bdellovibrionales bacterium]
MEKMELLAPAGSLEKLKFAYAYGADAAYAGVPFFSLRARENDFNIEKLKEATELRTRLGKKLFLTLNIFARNRKIKPFKEQIGEIAALKPDAFIMSDPGLIAMVKEAHPEIPIHLSVQANCMNWQAVKFWHQSVGVSRIILSRELNLNEITEIKNHVPDVELEAFVHGAICIAYSGRCLMSSYFSYRDANQGVCDNSCREKFKVYETPKQDKDYFIEDLRNKGEFYQISEDENGTYLMNAKDLNVIEHLDKIRESGVCSLKIEGRTKSIYYLSLVSKAYRKALDDLYAGKPFDPKIHDELAKISNRGYHTGFMIQDPDQNSQNYDTGISRYYSQRFAGVVREDENNLKDCLAIEVRNKVQKGQTFEVITPDGTEHFVIDDIYNEKGELTDVAHGGTGIKYFKSPIQAPPYSIVSLVEDHQASLRN